MKNPAAFISYARRDDAAYGGRITGLRERLQRMVAAAIGRDFEIFQDCEGIAWGQHWRTRLDEALEEALFLIPILTPSYFNSQACRTELETFLDLERRSGRKDRVLSLYFLDAPVYEQKNDVLAAILHERQHRDWRHLRIDPLGSAKVMRALDKLAREIAAAIHARQGAASPPSTVRDPVTQTPTPATIPPVPRESEAIAPPPASEGQSTVLRRTEIRALDTLALSDSTVLSRPKIRLSGRVLRDIDEPWCPELVVIPPGEFIMGSPEDEAARAHAEGPQHRVTFASPFALGRYPVTFEEYDHFCDSTTAGKKSRDQGWGRGRRPVINVSFDDAEVYCAWLSARTGGRQYRLPTEAEWEYACRAGTTTPYSTRATITTDQASYRPGKGAYREQTTRVGTFEANPWGLHDMHGNVWEWCADCWNASYQGAPSDGSTWTSGDCARRVIRGGSWDNRPEVLRSANRLGKPTDNRNELIGFRVARMLLPDESITF